MELLTLAQAVPHPVDLEGLMDGVMVALLVLVGTIAPAIGLLIFRRVTGA